MRIASIAAAAGALLLAGMADAAEIQVLSTQATQEAYLELVAQFEKASGHKVATIFTGTLNVQKRLADGEPYDLIIMAGPAMDENDNRGKARPGRLLAVAENRAGPAGRTDAGNTRLRSANPFAIQLADR